jgi:pseudaminic acid synthase
MKNINIGLQHKPFIIAEMSGNHNQSLERALKIVEAAALAGVDAIKLQTYTADTMTIRSDRSEFRINNKDSLWYGRTLYDLYEEAHTPWDWHKPLMDRAKELGIIFFSTPFDETAVDFLENLDVPLYKIASFENTDIQLIKKIAQTKKPIVISTGMAKVSDLELIVNTLREFSCENFVLLKCTSAYPAEPLAANINTIPHLREMFSCEVGLSDHTLGIGVAVASVALGATVIEKHFTLSRAEGGVDSDFSLEPHEMKALVDETKRAWQSLGKVHYGVSESEKDSLQFKRSIYFVENLNAGEEITLKNIRCIRPGYGLEPKHYFNLIGKKVKKEILRGEPVDWKILQD